ncbi:Protein spitz [Pseudolycoriella hygida]|uniref:Protein spitz n=1 Tax=Pseudolycoriella hygida TaxID=35572 RepID=A0A9Q0S1I2_9DIPT|nr:Protein spitz [Pseudolycoriella hygida]
MYLTMFAVMLAAVVSHTDCHFSNSEQATKQMSIEFINPEPLHGINALAMPCIEPYDTHFCLNGGRCFNVTVASYSLPSCECAEGFMGERCEQKYLSRSYNLENYMKSDDNIQKKNQSHIDIVGVDYKPLLLF